MQHDPSDALAAHLMLHIIDTFSTPCNHLREALKQEAASMSMTICHVEDEAEADTYMTILQGQLEGKTLAH